MPLGKYKDFAACVAAKKREGMSDESAKKYCGSLEQKIHGDEKKTVGQKLREFFRRRP